jgi:hypothetical protein
MTLAYPTIPIPESMRGPDGPRDRLANFLVEALPRKIDLLRQAWTLDEGKLPDLGKLSSGELPENLINSVSDAWIEVVNPRMLPGLRRVDITPAGDPVYLTRFSCRIFVWALGLDWDMSLARRDNIAAAVKMVLLEFPTLTLAGGDTGWVVLEETWSEEYGSPQRTSNQSGRCWCSAVLSVDVRAEQSLSAGRMRAPIGRNNSVVLDVAPVAPAAVIPHDLPRPPGWATPSLPDDLDPEPDDGQGTLDPNPDVTSDQDLDPSEQTGGTP